MARCIKKLMMIGLLVLGLPAAGITAGNIQIFVSIAPQKYFVQQIGKDRVDVHIMVAPGASPHTYEPRPRQMAGLSRAVIYFAVGVAFEDVWLDKIAAANPAMRVVHTDHGIDKIPMPADHPDDPAVHDDNDGPHTALGHGRLDPHIWLSPPLVKTQALTILAALQDVDPAHATDYAANCERFIATVDQLDAQFAHIFAGRTGLRFMVFHPSWGYFARAYGITQVAIEIQGKNPKPAQMKALIQIARTGNINVIFVQPQFSTKSADLVAREIGGQVVFADPLAEDWATNLQTVAGKFAAALK